MVSKVALLIWTFVAAINFGLWQQSFSAGLFAFAALVVLDSRSFPSGRKL